jgi:hypothetical protein
MAMADIRKEIFAQVDAEIEYAIAKWGTEFDDKNTLNDWVAYAVIYLARVAHIEAKKDDQEAALLKTIGLLVNALTRVKTNTLAARHYEKEVK